MDTSSTAGSSPLSSHFPSVASTRGPQRTYGRRQTRTVATPEAYTDDLSDTDTESDADGNVSPSEGKASRLSASRRRTARKPAADETANAASSGRRGGSNGRNGARHGSKALASKPVVTRSQSSSSIGSGVEDAQSGNVSASETDANQISPAKRKRVPSSSTTVSSNGRKGSSTTLSLVESGRRVSPRLSRSSSAASVESSIPSPRPSTPPRRRTAADAAKSPQTPRLSPRDLSSLFAGMSPRRSREGAAEGGDDAGAALFSSPLKKARAGGGLRQMLTRTESLGSAGAGSDTASRPDSPSLSTSRFGQTVSMSDLPDGRYARAVTPPPRAALSRTQSMPSTPSKTPVKSQGLDPSIAGSPSRNLLLPVPERQPGSGGGAKRTYGANRTILGDQDRSRQEGRSQSPEKGLFSKAKPRDMPKQSYAALRRQYEVDNTSYDSDNGGNGVHGDMLGVKPPVQVTDARAHGANRSFNDEVDALVASIEDPIAGMGLRRMSCIDVLQNMLDAAWLSKLEICGQVERVWATFVSVRTEGDDTMDALCLLFLVLLTARSSSGIDAMLTGHAASCVDVLMACIRQRQGVLDTPTGVKLKGSAMRIKAVTCDLTIGQVDVALASTRLLASAILASVTEEATWSHVGEALTSGETLSTILRAIAREFKSFPSSERSVAKVSRSASSMADSDLDLLFCLNCLQATSRIAGQSDESRLELSQTHVAFATDLIAGTAAFLDIALNSTEEDIRQRTAAQCLVESIKLFAVSANLSREWASTVAPSAGFVTVLGKVMLERQSLAGKAAGITHLRADDNGVENLNDAIESEELLCLVLAILTEALLVDPEAPAAFQGAVLTVNEGEGSSARAKRNHEDSRPLSSHLVSTYAHYSAQEDERDSTSGPIASYLALLLSKLIKSDAVDRDTLVGGLPGADRAEKLQGLLASLGELSGVQSVLSKMTSGGVPDDSMAIEEDAQVGGEEEDTVGDAISALKALLDAES